MHVTTVFMPRPQALHRDAALILASGFLATLAMTTIIYVLPLAGLAQVDLPVWVARLFTTDPVNVGALGMGLHVLVGMTLAWLYAEQIEPRLALGPGLAGLAYGIMLWVFAQAIAVPLLGILSADRLATPGMLSLGLGPAAALASLVAHMAYGTTLGLVYGCHWGGDCRQSRGSDGSVR